VFFYHNFSYVHSVDFVFNILLKKYCSQQILSAFQLPEQIIEFIKQYGALKPGDVCKLYGVSYVTARKMILQWFPELQLIRKKGETTKVDLVTLFYIKAYKEGRISLEQLKFALEKPLVVKKYCDSHHNHSVYSSHSYFGGDV